MLRCKNFLRVFNGCCGDIPNSQPSGGFIGLLIFEIFLRLMMVLLPRPNSLEKIAASNCLPLDSRVGTMVGSPASLGLTSTVPSST